MWWRRAAVVAAVVASGAGCTVSHTLTATLVTDEGAVLEGRFWSTKSGTATWWFEYGPTTAYGSTTELRSRTVDAGARNRIIVELVGLDEGTTYHYRLCSTDEDPRVDCGDDRTFTTTTGHDFVRGEGIVAAVPELGYVIGLDVRASSDAGGADPEGRVVASPGSAFFRFPDTGPVTCLRVEGSRASLVFIVEPPLDGVGIEPFPMIVHVADNGPAGDRYETIALEPDDEPPGCPEPLDEPALAIATGDFVVHDH